MFFEIVITFWKHFPRYLGILSLLTFICNSEYSHVAKIGTSNWTLDANTVALSETQRGDNVKEKLERLTPAERGLGGSVWFHFTCVDLFLSTFFVLWWNVSVLMGVVSVGITKWFFYNHCQCTLKLFWEYVVTRIPGFSFNLPLVCFWASSHLVLFQSVSTELYNDEIPAQQPKEIFNKTLMIMCYFIQPRNKAKRVIDTPLCRIVIYIVVSCPCVCVWCWDRWTNHWLSFQIESLTLSSCRIYGWINYCRPPSPWSSEVTPTFSSLWFTAGMSLHCWKAVCGLHQTCLLLLWLNFHVWIWFSLQTSVFFFPFNNL